MKKPILNKKLIFDILATNKDKIQNFGAKKLGLFGSFIRSEQQELSDIDMLVEFVPGSKTYDNFIHLAFFLEELFNRKIELITSESVSPYIKPYIEQEIEYVSFSN